MYFAPGSDIDRIVVDGSLAPAYFRGGQQHETVFTMGSGSGVANKNNRDTTPLMPQMMEQPLMPLH
jgi:hypothetical protein